MFTWGANSHSQLGAGDAIDRSRPEFVAHMNASQMSGGGSHSVVLQDGNVLACGRNSLGQIGPGGDSKMFRSVQLKDGKSVAQIACGWDFTLFLLTDGQVLVCGSNHYEQLCVEQIQVTTFGSLVELPLPKVRAIASGLRHAIAVTTAGEVFAWGANRRGQLGCKTSVNHTGSGDHTNRPIRVRLQASHGIPIDCAAGAHHSVILTDSGSLVVFGDLKYFRSPVGIETTEGPEAVSVLRFDSSAFNDHPVVQVASGWSHVVARTDNGDVFTWGRADLGQLGRPIGPSAYATVGPLFDPTPGKIEELACAAIEDIRAGSEHTLALDCQGRVWAWGWNEHGMCGVNSTDKPTKASPERREIPRPEQVTFFPPNIDDEVRVCAIGTGYGHSFACVAFS